MKILLINPGTPPHAGRDLFDADIFGSIINGKPFTKFYNGIPLGLPTIAAVTPQKHTVMIVDEMIEPINFDEDCDLVGITAMTFKASRAYEIAEKFMARNITVIMGGIHSTVCPDDAAKHVDSVVVGEAEEIWPKILEDFEKGQLQKQYKADAFPDVTKVPPPRYDLVKFKQYTYYTLQTARGCPHQCNFCTVTKINGKQIRKKTPEQIIKEIDCCITQYRSEGFSIRDNKTGTLKTYSGIIFFTDDNFAIDRKHAMAVCEAIQNYQKEKNIVFLWFTQVNYGAALDHELMKAMSDACCISLFMGFESLDPESLKEMKKPINKPEQYVEAINNANAYGMPVTFSTIIGSDSDTPATVDKIIDFIEEHKIYRALTNILTPYPGTVLYEEMVKDNRLIDFNSDNYNIRNVVYKPKGFSPDELQKEFVRLCDKVFSFKYLSRRVKAQIDLGSRWSLPLYLRPFFYLMVSYSAICLTLTGRTTPSVLCRFQALMFYAVIIKGFFPNCLYCAESVDFDAFARSEKKRFKTS